MFAYVGLPQNLKDLTGGGSAQEEVECSARGMHSRGGDTPHYLVFRLSLVGLANVVSPSHPEMLYLQSFLRKSVSLGHVGRN